MAFAERTAPQSLRASRGPSAGQAGGIGFKVAAWPAPLRPILTADRLRNRLRAAESHEQTTDHQRQRRQLFYRMELHARLLVLTARSRFPINMINLPPTAADELRI